MSIYYSAETARLAWRQGKQIRKKGEKRWASINDGPNPVYYLTEIFEGQWEIREAPKKPKTHIVECIGKGCPYCK